MSLVVNAPVPGAVVTLDDVPDPVFSGKIVGPGLAVRPDTSVEGEVTALAPVSGTIAKIHPHAYVIVAEDERAVLVHLGLNTVNLGGKGFTLHVSEGDAVAAGQPVTTWSPAEIEKGGLNPIVPVIALDAKEADLEAAPAGTIVLAGDTLLTWS